MKDYSELKQEIIDNIRANGRGAITGPLLQEQLLNICDKMELQSFEGFATPSVTPVRDYTSEHFYFAVEPGDYSEFADGLFVEEGDFYLLYRMPGETDWNAENLKDYFKGDKGQDGADGSLLFPTVDIDANGNLYVEVPDSNETNLVIDGEDLCVVYPDYNV